MMKFKLIIASILILIVTESYAQVQIEMQNENGIYTMPCEINGLKLRFILDTGASDISISLTEVVFMLKNGYFDINDIIGSAKYQTANGEINEGTLINLREVNIGGLKLQNIQASVVSSTVAPLLLGQSALSKLGKFQFDYDKNILTFTNNESISENNDDSYAIKENSEQNKIDKEIKFSKELEKKAIKGDIASQIILGDCYYKSKGVKFRADSALFWYSEAESQGSIEAIHKLGDFYQFLLPNSSNVNKTRKACLSYFTEAANKGYSESQYWLGLMYFSGKSFEPKYWLGITQDFDTAFEYFMKSQEHPTSQYFLGQMYYEGIGIKKDFKQAFFWFSKSAELGDIKSQTYLGMCYFDGNGTLKNPERAIFWWQKAAEANDSMAQYALGMCYFKGIGVNTNKSKAAYWIEKAYKNGNEDAKNFWEKTELWKY